jgi:hypothetical protein
MMKKYLKIPNTDVGFTYFNVLGVIWCRPADGDNTITQLQTLDGVVNITHAAETDNAMTRWWYENVQLIADTPYEEVIFEATEVPFEISAISPATP